jgi:hypothetical protein
MSNTETEATNFKLGQDLFLAGYKYHQVPAQIEGPVKAAVYRGFEDQCRLTKCGYTNQHWNRMGGYKTSSDIKTLF